MDGRTNFIILTNGRSGSNNLVDLLNRHPQILNYGEVLGPWTTAWRRRGFFGHSAETGAAVSRYLDGFFDNPAVFYAAQAAAIPSRLSGGRALNLKRRGKVAALGLKDFQLMFERRGVADYAVRRDDLKVIGLVRANPVRRFLSSAMLGETGQVALAPGAAAQTAKLNLSPDKFLEGVMAVDGENRRLDAALDAAPRERVIRIEYADYFGDADRMAEINDNLFSFLGVEPIDARSGHRKLNARSLKASIENYDEIREALGASPFADDFVRAEIGG